jgi:hypothetical protein
VLALAALWCGCASAPPAGTPVTGPTHSAGGLALVTGGQDSTSSAPGSAAALYKYRFEMTMPGGAGFTFQDRDLSFYLRPAPDALYFQVENRTDRPVWIDWDRSAFYRDTKRDQVAHATTRYADRFNVQPATQIAGLQRYSDYLLPMEFLADPGTSN